MLFLESECYNLDGDFIEVCSLGGKLTISNNGSDNVLAPTRWQAIILVKDS